MRVVLEELGGVGAICCTISTCTTQSLPLSVALCASGDVRVVLEELGGVGAICCTISTCTTQSLPLSVALFNTHLPAVMCGLSLKSLGE